MRLAGRTFAGLLHALSTPTIALFSCAQIAAQTLPNSGSILWQLESQRELPIVKPLPPEKLNKSSSPRKAASAEGLSVEVKRFVVAGNTLLSDEQLQGALSAFVNQTLDFAKLEAATQAVAALYQKSGWRVLAYLPKQEVDQGVITIQVVESRLGELVFEGAPSKRVSKAQIQSILEAQQKVGEPLNQVRLERGVLIANQLSGLSVNSAFKEGETAQTTDVVLQLIDKPVVAGDIGLDNTGSAAAGQNRLSANAELRSLAGVGDVLSTNVSRTSGSEYGRLSYVWPVGSQGWRMGLNVSRLKYELISAEFKALQAKGSSSSTGLEASYPLVMRMQGHLHLTLNADTKTFDNQSNGAVTSRYAANNVALGLNGSSWDGFGGGGANALSMSLVSGRLNLNASPNQASDEATTRTNGEFSKLRFNVSRLQALMPKMAVYAGYAGQKASKNLDSSEKLYLGGANGVRAYPSNEAGGSVGQLVNLELRTYLPHSVTLTGFYDWGQVHVNRNNNYPGANPSNRLALQGAGLALAWQPHAKVIFKATWARRIGQNPAPTATGADQDGTLQKDRFWFTTSLAL